MGAVVDVTGLEVSGTSGEVVVLAGALLQRSAAFSVTVAFLTRFRGGCFNNLVVMVGEEVFDLNVSILMDLSSGTSPVSSQAAERKRSKISIIVQRPRDSLLLVFLMLLAKVSIFSITLPGSLR